MFPNEIRPYQSYAYHRRQTRDAVDVAQVGVLDIEAGGLHGAKACLNLPALFVGCHGSFRTIVANQDLQLRHSIRVFKHGTCNIDIFPFEEKQLVVDTLLSELEPVKQMPSPYILAGFGIAQPKILLDSQVVSDASVVEILDPLLADKLSVGNEGIIHSAPNSRINLSISCVRSCQLELPRLSSKVKSNGNATPLYVTPSMRILMLTSPNFQLVRSRLRTSPVLTGRSANITLAIMSRLRAYSARNLCRRRRLESRSTLVGIAEAILCRLTVCTTQRA
jgi:hypothetical protein